MPPLSVAVRQRASGLGRGFVRHCRRSCIGFVYLACVPVLVYGMAQSDQWLARANGTSPDTELLNAAAHADLRGIKSALASGAHIQGTAGNVTPLVCAVLSHRSCAVSFLLQHGAAINAADANGNTALMYAANLGDLKMLETLIEAGADINHANTAGHRAVDWAGQLDHSEVTLFLEQAGRRPALAEYLE